MHKRFHFLPFFAIFSIIFLCTLCYNNIFSWYAESFTSVNFFIGAVAVGALIIGFISDKYPRKTVLICGLATSIPCVILCYWLRTIPLLILCGLLLNPLPIVRATLIDNLHTYSKIRLLSLSFAMQFAPSILWSMFVQYGFLQSIHMTVFLLFLMLIIAIFCFKDDKIHAEIPDHGIYHFFHHDCKQKGLYTLLAFIPTQLVFFFADGSLERTRGDPYILAMIAAGLTLGSLISLFYKSTPHTSIITVAYGFSFISSFLPILGKVFYKIHYENPTIQIITYGSQLGFYIPFVYDVVLSSVNKSLRSTTCGIMDFIYFITYLTSLVYLDIFQIQLLGVAAYIPVLFLVALILQKRSESAS